MVAMMASTDTIEELTREDCADLPECICAGWVHTDEPRRYRPYWHDNLNWTEWYDLEVLQAWVTLNAAKA